MSREMAIVEKCLTTEHTAQSHGNPAAVEVTLQSHRAFLQSLNSGQRAKGTTTLRSAQLSTGGQMDRDLLGRYTPRHESFMVHRILGFLNMRINCEVNRKDSSSYHSLDI